MNNDTRVEAAFDAVAEFVEEVADEHPDVCMVLAVVWPEDTTAPHCQLFGNLPKQQAATVLATLAAQFAAHVAGEQ